ncbi:MAG: lysophospholipid acyltransferase family protein [Robiginitomaculum sp.]
MMNADKPGRTKSIIFHVMFYMVTAFFAVLCALLALLPGRKPMMIGLSGYTKTIRFLMGAIVDIDVQVTGRENLPKSGMYIIASKHQSYGDGIIMFTEFFDLSFVAGDAIAKFTLIKTILRKAGAVIIDNCGGSDVRDKMTREVARVKKEERKLLIYPEGHLSEIGTQHRYRKGVYHMYKDFDCPVVPAATNLGQRWNQSDLLKYPGRASLEFLPPILPGLGKDEFMAQLEAAIETRSRELLDMDNLGALNPDNIGRLKENHVAEAKRIAREGRETKGEDDSTIEMDEGAKS